MQENNKLVQYSREIVPAIRDINEVKDALKAFKETSEKYLQLTEAVKEAKEAAKAFLEDDATSKNMLEEIRSRSAELKEAVVAAADGTDYKPGELKAYFNARAVESVDVVIGKGNLFDELNKELVA